MKKRLELTDPKSCLNKAENDEPLFVLRAQDATAGEVIRFWLRLNPQIPSDKFEEAIICAIEMDEWPNRKAAD